MIYLDTGDVGKKSSLMDIFRRVILLRKILKREAPDIVIPFLSSSFVPTVMALAFTKISILASEHSVFRASKSPMVWFPFVLSTFGVKKITCVSEAVKKTFPWLIRRKMYPVPNPLPREMFDEIGCTGGTERKIFLSVGRLESPKDFSTLISAFHGIAGELPEWDLYIYGEGGAEEGIGKNGDKIPSGR